MPFKAVTDDDVDQQVDALRDRFGDLDRLRLAAHRRRYATIDITGSIDGERSKASRPPTSCTGSVPSMVVAELDTELRGTRPARSSSSTPRSPNGSASSPASEVTVPSHGERSEAEGASRAHRRVGERSQRVRHDRRTARRRAQAARDDAEAASADGGARPGARSRGGSCSGRGARTLDRRARRAAESRISRTGFRIRARTSSSTSRRRVKSRRRSSTRSASAPTRAVLADLALRAVVAQEEITRDRRRARRRDRRASQSGPSRSRRKCGASSNEGALWRRYDLRSARGKALEFLVDHATVVDEDGNEIDLDDPR